MDTFVYNELKEIFGFDDLEEIVKSIPSEVIRSYLFLAAIKNRDLEVTFLPNLVVYLVPSLLLIMSFDSCSLVILLFLGNVVHDSRLCL